MPDREKPQRIQLKRTKGWRLQEHSKALNGREAVKVDRTTKWGNPFPIGEEGPLGRTAIDAEGATGFFRDMLNDPEMRRASGYPEDVSELNGKNLACWCGGRHCHADVLLALANPEGEK